MNPKGPKGLKHVLPILIAALLIINIGLAQAGQASVGALSNIDGARSDTESKATSKPIALLFERNREVRSAEYAYRAALEKVKTRGVLPDPKLEVSTFLQPIETRNGPMENQLMLGQKFPLWGKLKRERGIAREQAEIAGEQLQRKKIIIAFQARKAWEDFQRLNNSLLILQQYKIELESFRSIALTQYSTGVGITQHPILKLQIEIALIESKINSFQQNLEASRNALQALFDNTFSKDIFGDERTAVVPKADVESWLSLAEANHPDYKIARHQVVIATLQNELARSRNRPDMVAGITYTMIGNTDANMAPTPGDDALGVKVGLNLPLWFNRNKARVRSTGSMLLSSEETLEHTWNKIESSVRTTKNDLDEILETFALYEDQLMQESDQMLESAYAAYETGKINFLDLLDSERMVVRVRLEFEAVDAKRRIASAKLLKDIGVVHRDEGVER